MPRHFEGCAFPLNPSQPNRIYTDNGVIQTKLWLARFKVQAMMDNEKNGIKPNRQYQRDPKQNDVRTYPLETIMALQKALEGGITPEETSPRPNARGAEPGRAIASDAQSALITRIRKSLAQLGCGLGRVLRSAVGSKEQSKQTSAR